MGILENISSKIDRLELKIDISNKKLDELLDRLNEKPSPPIGEVEPPITKPTPPIEPEPPVVAPLPPLDEVLDLDEFLDTQSGVVRLPKWVKVIRSKGMIQPKNVTALVGNQIVTFENWDRTPTQLFDLSGCNEFAVVGINFVTPPNRPIMTGFPDKEIFGWKRDSIKSSAKFAWINPPEIDDKERVTYGLSRFCYSSDSEDKIYLIGKNIKHNGFNFTQIKNPYNGNLYLALLNCCIHNPIIEQPQSHYYSPTKIKVKIRIKDGVAKIISDNTYSQIKTHWGYRNGVVRSLLHFDRYVYDITDDQVLDDKTLKLNLKELQAGDIVDGLKVIQKQISHSNPSGFAYTSEMSSLPNQKYVPNGEHDAFIIYKGNALFSSPFLTENSKFGDWYITLSNGYGWSWYNQEFSGYIENFNGTGYFRNSTGSQGTHGLTIKNSSFEKNAPKATSNKPLDSEVKKYVEYLEGLV